MLVTPYWGEGSLLGLSRGTVKLVPYTPAWTELYEQEKAQLHSALGTRALDIQHIGSTAVPGLAAKPVLDIGVAVADLKVICTVIEEMFSLGYRYFGDQKQRGDHFFAKGPNDSQSCFVHMVESTDSAWQDFLRFRDYLRAHPKYRDQYMKLKDCMAKRHSQDRRAYTESKAELIQEILTKARCLQDSPT